jgi:CRP/FNR family transcriptional regulator
MKLKMDMRRFLSGIFLFTSFTEKEVELLEASISLKKVNKGEQIFSEGLEATAFFIVVSGKVKIYKLSHDGKEQILHIHSPGDLVAEAAIFDSMVYPASCMALEDSTLVRISRDRFVNLVKEHPEMAEDEQGGRDLMPDDYAADVPLQVEPLHGLPCR